jgi:SAM-dependent MidA family methyltransferase
MDQKWIKIRKIRIDDIPAIWRINFECWKNNYKWIIDNEFLNGITIERWIEKAKIYYNKTEVFGLVKEIEWKIVWFIDGHANNNKEFEINRLY